MTLRQALLSGRGRPRRHADGTPLQFRGDGYEFVELREYVQGDDVRRIDWAASARSTQLQTRVLLEDVALTLGVYVDRSASMQAGRMRSLFQAAEEIAQTWRSAALRTDRLRSFNALHEAAALPRGAALLAVFDGYAVDPQRDGDLLASLGFRCDCTAMIARDPWQDDLPLSGFVRLRDAESDDARLCYFGSRERERYANASRALERKTAEFLESRNWRTGVFRENDGREALLRAFGAAA